MQDAARLRIRHHGHVPVPAAERGLVHRKAPDRFRLAARKSPRHRTLHDSIHRVPAQPHPPGDRLYARFLEPPDHFRLELRRVPRTLLRPRHMDRDHPVLRALDPRDVADQKGLVAPGIHVPPLTAPRIVARAGLAAVRAPQPAPHGPLQLHPKFLRLPRRLHPRDLPLGTQARTASGQLLPAMSATSFPSHCGTGAGTSAPARPRNLPRPRPSRKPARCSSRSAAVPVASVPHQALVRGLVREGHSAASAARLPLPAGSTVHIVPHPMIRLRPVPTHQDRGRTFRNHPRYRSPRELPKTRPCTLDHPELSHPSSLPPLSLEDPETGVNSWSGRHETRRRSTRRRRGQSRGTPNGRYTNRRTPRSRRAACVRNNSPIAAHAHRSEHPE